MRSHKNSYKIDKNIGGYTLIELGVVILIAGIVLGLGLRIVPNLVQTTANIETQGKMQIISEALSYYASVNYRLPCPAEPERSPADEPFGFENGSGADGDIAPNNGCDDLREGIVPFNTLGLTEADITDGYGNAFTYAVSPVFTLDPQESQDADNDVHPQCRTAYWFFRDGVQTSYSNRNPLKAYFCCPAEDVFAPASDLTVLDENDDSVIVLERNDDIARPYAGVETLIPDTIQALDDQTRTATIAYTLVSHGKNGFGAFDLSDGSRPNAVEGGDIEDENADGDITYRYDVEYSQDYDDYVIWRTQDNVMNEAGESCVYP